MVSLSEHFILQKVAEAEKIDIKTEDLDNEIARIADIQGESFRKLKAQMERDDQLEALATELMERQALDIILNNAEYEEYQLRPEDDAGEVATVTTQAVPGELVEPQEGSK
jgi:trigger factor